MINKWQVKRWRWVYRCYLQGWNVIICQAQGEIQE